MHRILNTYTARVGECMCISFRDMSMTRWRKSLGLDTNFLDVWIASHR